MEIKMFNAFYSNWLRCTRAIIEGTVASSTDALHFALRRIFKKKSSWDNGHLPQACTLAALSPKIENRRSTVLIGLINLCNCRSSLREDIFIDPILQCPRLCAVTILAAGWDCMASLWWHRSAQFTADTRSVRWAWMLLRQIRLVNFRLQSRMFRILL